MAMSPITVGRQFAFCASEFTGCAPGDSGSADLDATVVIDDSHAFDDVDAAQQCSTRRTAVRRWLWSETVFVGMGGSEMLLQ